MARPATPAAAPPQRQRYARLTVLGPVLVLAGLLLGSAFAFGYEQFFAEESPTATAESQTITLRRQSADRLEDQSTARFWFPFCDKLSPMCTAYIAGFLEMQTGLARPFFCAGNRRVAEVEALIVKELRLLNKVAPKLLDTHHMSIIVIYTLERELPCETRLAQASKSRLGRVLDPHLG
jgi:hypothetical protein